MRSENTVHKSYDKIAKKYHKQRYKYRSKRLLAKFSRLVPKGARIIDLGCGAGVPVAKFLAGRGCKVTGIDFSSAMLKLARKNVPKARFVKADMTKMKFKPGSFDGAVSFYAMIHVPRQKHAKVYKNLHQMLKSDGIMLVNASGPDKEGLEGCARDYLGVPMFWSFYSPKRTLRIIKTAGFDVFWSSVLKLGGERQFWVLARNR
ncbi:MAG: methyltransferase domain-containing protein [Candidatus Micrarchaeota archaeon]